MTEIWADNVLLSRSEESYCELIEREPPERNVIYYVDYDGRTHFYFNSESEAKNALGEYAYNVLKDEGLLKEETYRPGTPHYQDLVREANAGGDNGGGGDK